MTRRLSARVDASPLPERLDPEILSSVDITVEALELHVDRNLYVATGVGYVEAEVDVDALRRRATPRLACAWICPVALLKCARETIRFNRPSDSGGPFAPRQATNSKRSVR